MEMKTMTLIQFTEQTISGEPAPGGGSVSALAGALAASLAGMVAGLTIGKKGYEAGEAQMREIASEAEALRVRLLDDITRDSRSFNAYMDAMGLPKETDEQKAVRRQAMQDALKIAANVPFEVANTAAGILPLAETAVRLGNRNAVTDGLVAAMMARTAVLGALLNVRINLGSIKDESYVADLSARADALEKAVCAREAAILALSPLR